MRYNRTHVKIPGQLLTNRSFRVKIQNSLSNIHTIENGLPQGFLLSVTLFLAEINDIYNNLPFPVKYKFFADDCNIYCYGTNYATSAKLLQKSLNILSQWALRTGFIFSPSKNQGIIFSNKK